jgi:hypothetical protein
MQGAEERRLRRMYEAQGKGPRAQGKNQCHLYSLLTLSLEPYALCREIEERSRATPLELAKSRLGGEMTP